MTILTPNPDLRITGVRIDTKRLSIDRVDGRSVSVPLAGYSRLFNASPQQLVDAQ